MTSRQVEGVMDAILAMNRNPTAEDFASIMGFIEPTIPAFGNLDEIAKFLGSCHLLRQLRMRMAEREQNIVYHKFTALYLPKLVNTFLDPPTQPPGTPQDLITEFRLNNPYMEMMSAISHTPYFTKFLRAKTPSAEGGKRLVTEISKRLLDNAPIWDHKMLNTPLDREPGYYESAAGTSLQMLSTLLAAFIKEPKDSPLFPDSATRKLLIPWLEKWERRHSREFLGRVSERAKNLLENNSDWARDANMIRMMLKNWNSCGYPGCSSSKDLKACSRCQTVRYCSPEHQRAHWTKLHKSLCFKADY